MKKITFLLALLLSVVSAGSLSADNTLLTTANGLPGTLSNGQYSFTSDAITATSAAKHIRITFYDTYGHNTWADSYKFVCLSEFYLYKADGTEIDLAASNFSTNATEATGEGPLSNICDGETGSGNYWHSAWNNSVGTYHYLQIAVPDDVTDLTSFKIGWVTRNASNAPISFMVQTSSDAAPHFGDFATTFGNLYEIPEFAAEFNPTATDANAALLSAFSTFALDQNQDAVKTAVDTYNANAAVTNKILTTLHGLPSAQTTGQITWKSDLINLVSEANAIRLTVKRTNTMAKSNGHVFFTLAEFDLYDSSDNEIALTVEDFSTNAQEASEGPIAGICDNDLNSYLHTAYNNPPNEDHYLMVNFPSALQEFKIGLTSRNQNNIPSFIVIEPLTVADVKSDLQAVIDALTPYESLIGPDFGQYNTGSYTLSDELTTANAVIANASATVPQILAAIEQLQAVQSSLDINKPAAGSFIRIKAASNSTKAPGYYLSADTFTPSGKQSRATFTADKDGDNNAKSIFYFADNKLLNYSTGYYITLVSNFASYNAVGESTSVAFGTDTGVKSVYTVTLNGARHLYAQSGTESGTTYYYADCGGNTAYGAGYDFDIEEVNALPVTVTAAGYATFCAPVAVSINSNVKAYKATKETGKLVLTEITDVIPANEPVIIAAAEGTYDMEITTTEATVTGNDLVGTLAAETVTAASCYTLQNLASGVGFYRYSGTVLGGFKAYVAGASDGTSRGLALDFGNTTGLEVINADGTSATIYDLSGRQVKAAQKGFYIVDGKKVIK